MPPNKKPKKGSLTGNTATCSTLHDYFASSPSKRATSGQGPKASPNLTAPTEQNIIIIDSDDDSDDIEVISILTNKFDKGKKRQRPDSSDSDVEFVGIRYSASKTLANHRSPDGSSSLQTATSSSVKLEFGLPSDLLCASKPQVPRTDGSPPTPESQSQTRFGAPTSLLRPDSDSFSESAGLKKPSRIPSSSSVTLATSDNLPEETEWGTGDDELFASIFPEEDTQILDQAMEDVLFNDEVLAFEERLNDNCSSILVSNGAKKPNGGTVTAVVPQMKSIKSEPATSNVFSVIMSSHKDNQAWEEATAAEDSSFRASKNNRRKAPFYKVLQGMPIAVDAFRYGIIPGVTAYFLTHAHSDHYTNLSSSWKSGPIYCSEATANLIIHMLNVDKSWVHPLPMDTPTLIPNTNGVHVTLIEANHCPGSCLFFFEGLQTVDAGDSAFQSPFVGSPTIFRYLHCGDFRASPQHVLHAAVKGKKIDHVYLDTTYLDPRYTFPPQPLVVSACAQLAHRIANGISLNGKPSMMDGWLSSVKSTASGKAPKQADRILFVIGTYSIGKERIVKAVAQALQSKIFCERKKMGILRCQSDPELHSMLTSDPLTADVHVVPLALIALDKLKTYLQRYQSAFSRVVGFRPTGWSYSPGAGSTQIPSIDNIISRNRQKGFTYSDLKQSRNSSPVVQLYGVPYSEHSSFYELTCFALSFNWSRIIATVNVGSESSRSKMTQWFSQWEEERKRQGSNDVIPYRQPDYW